MRMTKTSHLVQGECLHDLAPVVTVSPALPVLRLTAVIKSSQTSPPPPLCIHEHLGFTTRIDTLSI
jgi:hypothetical protein